MTGTIEDRIRARLLTLKAALEGRGATSQPAAPGAPVLLGAVQHQTPSIGDPERRKREVGRIESALRRLEAGTYGRCEKCGDTIEEWSLSADPAAAYCAKCGGDQQ